MSEQSSNLPVSEAATPMVTARPCDGCPWARGAYSVSEISERTAEATLMYPDEKSHTLCDVLVHFSDEIHDGGPLTSTGEVALRTYNAENPEAAAVAEVQSRVETCNRAGGPGPLRGRPASIIGRILGKEAVACGAFGRAEPGKKGPTIHKAGAGVLAITDAQK